MIQRPMLKLSPAWPASSMGQRLRPMTHWPKPNIYDPHDPLTHFHPYCQDFELFNVVQMRHSRSISGVQHHTVKANIDQILKVSMQRNFNWWNITIDSAYTHSFIHSFLIEASQTMVTFLSELKNANYFALCTAAHMTNIIFQEH